MVDKNAIDAMLRQLWSIDTATIIDSLSNLESYLPGLDEDSYKEAVDALYSLFYIDIYEQPELQPAVNFAIDIIARQGPKVIPYLLSELQNSDLKAELNLAKAFAKIGPPVIEPLRQIYLTSNDGMLQSFILFAISKITDKKVSVILPDLIAALRSSHQELRDTATRAVGKVVEKLIPGDIPTEDVNAIFQHLWFNLADNNPSIRSKAVRSLSKFIQRGFYEPGRVQEVEIRMKGILGKDDQFNWDRAYIVRREAGELVEVIEKMALQR